ncbi:MAG: tRNA lysidine(34) synthetase TilS [Lautropia sp.]|nr:tRNA lysidine(34) synthetase TilS [Lautropia sp.]
MKKACGSPVDCLASCLQQAEAGSEEPVLLACSGGRDSQVLLHAAAALQPEVKVVVAHVHHGLQSDADAWLDFCAAEAAALRLPFLSRRLNRDATGFGPAGLEAWARAGRYRALAEMAIAAGARYVLTAHHANDQLETVELRRRRGSGILGLSGMRVSSSLPYAPSGMRLLRPFLGLSRLQLAAWAKAHGVSWVEDPSNQDLRLARNRVRRNIDARLQAETLSMPDELLSIGLLQQASDRVQRQAEADVASCTVHLSESAASLPQDGRDSGALRQQAVMLSRAAFMRLPGPRRAHALRWWLGYLGCRMPSRHKLQEIERQLLMATASQAMVRHDGVTLLRYRDRLGVWPTLPALVPVVLRWQGESLIELPAGRLYIIPVPVAEEQQASSPVMSLDAHWLRHVELLIDQGRGGERLRLSADGPSRSLKKLMQARGIPTCLRESLPVLRLNGVPIFAAPFGLLVSDALADARSSGERVRLSWSSRPVLSGWI